MITISSPLCLSPTEVRTPLAITLSLPLCLPPTEVRTPLAITRTPEGGKEGGTSDLTFVYPFIYPFRVRTPVTFGDEKRS